MSTLFSSVLKQKTPNTPTHLVFFHGIGCNGSVFHKIAQNFNLTFHYESTQGVLSLDEISKNCVERLRQSIGSGTAIAVGHSLGGVTATKTVEQAPELFQGLVLCNTRYHQTQQDRSTKETIIKKVERLTDEQFLKVVNPSFFKNQESALSDEDIELLIRCLKAAGRTVYLEQMRLSLEESSPNYQKLLATLPITVIQGQNDSIIPHSGWERSGLQEAETRHRLELMQCTGGHLSILKHPELITRAIQNMLTPSLFNHESAPDFGRTR